MFPTQISFFLRREAKFYENYNNIGITTDNDARRYDIGYESWYSFALNKKTGMNKVNSKRAMDDEEIGPVNERTRDFKKAIF